MSLFSSIKYKMQRYMFRKRWRKKNGHNLTQPMNLFNPDCVHVGQYTYGGINLDNYNINNKLIIGAFCSIATEVKFILDADHYVNHLSTYPYKVHCLQSVPFEGVSKGDIIIDDDVWIGYGATILSGVHVSQGAVIAAGAVVSHNVPPYSIVGGIPAKVIKYRFSKSVIDYLMTLNYGALTKQQIKEHIDDLYADFEGLELEDIETMLSWFPKI